MNVARFRVICGVARSGTTFAREVLHRAIPGVVINEPLNRVIGIVNVPAAYPYVSAGGGEYASLIDDVVSFNRRWSKIVRYKSTWGPFRRRAYWLASRERKIMWQMLGLANYMRLPLPPVLCKDPFATFAMPYLVEHYGVRAVCMIRHPAGVHAGFQKQGWPFNIVRLTEQSELMQAYGDRVLPAQWKCAQTSNAASVAILWKLMINIVGELADRDSRILLVRHEDLCRDPFGVAETMLAHFGLGLNSVARRFLISHTQEEDVRGDGNYVHNLTRDSQAIPDAWREQISSRDEAIMQEIIGDDFYRIYSQW